MNKYTVTIIGLGNIGMMYDYDNSDDNVFLSHTKSFYHHPNFEIRNLIEPDKKKLELAKKKYNGSVNFLKRIDDIIEVTDVVVLASMPEVNRQIFNKLKEIDKIRLFLIEKPFWNSSMSFAEYSDINEKCYINYFRKSLPFFRRLRDRINKNEFGNLLGVHVIYSKGLRNNGSHIIDFINFSLDGSFDLDNPILLSEVDDYIEGDKSLGFKIDYLFNGKKAPVIFQASNEKSFSLIEMDFLLEEARFRIYDFGGKVEYYKVESDPVFPRYKNMTSKEIIDTNINYYGYYTCTKVKDIIECRTENDSTLKHEFEIFQLIDSVKKLANE